MPCTKVVYHNQQQAQLAAEQLSLLWGNESYPYACSFCQKWHLSTHKAKLLPEGIKNDKPSMSRRTDSDHLEARQIERDYWLHRTLPKKGWKAQLKRLRGKNK